MQDPRTDGSQIALQAADLRSRMETALAEVSAILTDAYAAGFMIHFEVVFDQEGERFVPRPVRISKEF